MNTHSRAPNAVCATCLSQGRQMFTLPLQHIKPVSMFYKELTLTNNEKICWECKHFVIKMVNFKNRALKAQGTLAGMIDKQPISLQSLSKLKISKGKHLEITNPQKIPTEENPLIEVLKTEPNLDYGNEWNMKLASMESGKNDDEVTFEVYQHKVKPRLESVIKLEPIAEDENPGVWEASVFEEQVPQRQAGGGWGGAGLADATLMSLLNRKHISYPPPMSAVPQRKLPMMEVPTLRILPKNPMPESNVEKCPLRILPKNPMPESNVEKRPLENFEKSVSDPSGPSFTEERLTEEERQRWWESKRENEFYADSIEVFKCEKCVEPFFTRRTFLGHQKMHTELFGKHSCEICELRFHTGQALATHKDTHYRLLKCTRCAHAWDSVNSMRRHCEVAHRVPVIAWNCDICSKLLTYVSFRLRSWPTNGLAGRSALTFGNYGRYLNHVRGHGREPCPQCGKGVFVARMKCHMLYLNHVRGHGREPCPQCGKGVFMARLKCHMLYWTHVRGHGREPCPQCGKGVFMARLKCHMLYWTHVRGHGREPCPQCGKGVFVARLKCHMLYLNHVRGHGREPCPQCGKGVFVARLKCHMLYLTHVRGHGREPCPQCGKGVFVARMKCHMLTHKDVDRPFKCSECDKSFKIKQHLYSHVTRVHSPKDDVMYCAQCDKQFKNSYSYNNHMKYASEHISKGLLTHSCTECSRVFPNRGLLRQHVARVHRDERKYECQVCHEMFKSSSTRARHRRLTHENYVAPRDKICDHCGKGFKVNICSLMSGRPSYMCQSSSTRARHRRLTHENYVAPRDKICDHCGKGFKVNICSLMSGRPSYMCQSSSTRARHRRLTHEHYVAPRDKICDHCGKGFKVNICSLMSGRPSYMLQSSSTRARHRRLTHEHYVAPRDKICDHCGKGFKVNICSLMSGRPSYMCQSSSTRVRHRRLTHEHYVAPRDKICDHCGKGFKLHVPVLVGPGAAPAADARELCGTSRQDMRPLREGLQGEHL
ncbi:zinc finger protein 607-like [Cydia fagiglandana]|uniref:zinc finger protein 607-like n=1 Tax=Cydia fagiglandana TaxID=1458189 RepID=UPI002FEDF7D2